MFCHVIRPNVFIESISRLSHELRFYVRIIQLASQSNQPKIKIVHLRYNQHGSLRHNGVTVLNFKLSKANLFCSAGVSTLMLVSSSLMQRITSSICRPFCILLVTSYMQMYNDDDISFYFVFFEY